MNIDEMTIGQAKELANMFSKNELPESSLNSMIGEKVIIRTYSAGVFFGVLSEKSGNEVIIKDARRLWKWQTKKSISLSSVAKYGIKSTGSKVAPSLQSIWLEAIEIIPCTEEAIKSIESQEDVEAN